MTPKSPRKLSFVQKIVRLDHAVSHLRDCMDVFLIDDALDSYELEEELALQLAVGSRTCEGRCSECGELCGIELPST